VAVEVVEADLADPAERQAAVADRHLYALVNNAGYLNAGLLRDVGIDEARRQLEVMVLAPLDLAQRALPHMLRRGEGRIVNVTSAAVHTSTAVSGWYQASKAALRELTDALRLELASTGIDVIDVEPGGFKTGIWGRGQVELAERRRHSAEPDAYRQAARAIERAEPKMGQPEEVATTIGQALTTAHPKVHYRVGRDAGPLRVVAELVPDRWWDRVSARASGVA